MSTQGFFSAFFGAESPPTSPRKKKAGSPESTSLPSTRPAIDHKAPSSASAPPSVRVKNAMSKRKELEDLLLHSEVIDLQKLREHAFNGLPEGRLRALSWKILLQYLPLRRSLWEEELDKHRKMYQEWHTVFMSNNLGEQESPGLTVEETPATDDPLNLEQSSEWNEFFKDGDLMFEVEKDVHRTFPHLHFFQTREVEESEEMSPQHERMLALKNPHYRAMRYIVCLVYSPMTYSSAILFLWAKLNPGVGYIQGMNELLGPIYYLFATDSDLLFREHAEADAFFCFNSVMSERKDVFIKSLDNTLVGVQVEIEKLNQLLKIKDYELWEDLNKKEIHPQFYSFRWLTLLLGQELELPDLMSLFADENRYEHLYFVCVAMIILLRDTLLSADFATTLKTLQHYPPASIDTILHQAQLVADPSYRESVPPEEKEAQQAKNNSSEDIASSIMSFFRY